MPDGPLMPTGVNRSVNGQRWPSA